MLFSAIAFAAAVLAPVANEVSLKCMLSAEQPDPRTLKDFYGAEALDVDQNRFIQDVADHGIMLLAIQPSEFWVINYDAGVVNEVDGARLAITDLTSSTVTADAGSEHYTRVVSFNRLSGKATFTNMLSDVSSWNEEFGVKLSNYRQWSMDCRPAIAIF